MNAPHKDDRIFPVTRIVAAVVVPFLVLAFIILFFFPEQTGARFAWKINPPMTAAFMGAGYLGGSWLFINAIFGRRWHTIAPGFPAVTTFTIAMLLVTVLHWEIFDLSHLPFQLWLALYVITPFLVPWLWWRNRQTDPGRPQADDKIVPTAARWSLLLLGGVLLLFAVGGLIFPNWLISLWPWTLSIVTARILSGWFALLGVGGLVIGGERRWSSWTVGLQSIGLWHLLVLVAALRNPADFQHGLLNWYLVSVVLVLAGMLGLSLYMWRLPLNPTGRTAS